MAEESEVGDMKVEEGDEHLSYRSKGLTICTITESDPSQW